MNLIFNEYTKKYLKMSLSLFIIAVSYNLFITPINLVAGGAGGLGVLFYNLFGIEPSIVIFLVSFLMFLLAIFTLDFEDIISILYAAIIYPLFIKLTSDMTNYVSFNSKHTLVVVLFGAILTGIGQGLIFKDGLNIGGLSVLAKVLNKYTKVSITYANLVINGIVILFGAFFIRLSLVLYAIIFVYVLRYVSERIMLGASNNKTLKIISTKYKKIEKYIYSLGHDVTIYDTVGSFLGDKKKLIMVVVPTSKFIMVKDYVRSVDKNAFMFVTNTYDVSMQDITIQKGIE